MKFIARKLVGIVVAAVLVAAVGALIPRPLFRTAMGGEQSHTIYFISNAIHTDIAIPLDEDIRQRFAFIGQDGLPLANPNAQWLIIGWGGRSFYIETPTWADLKPLPVLRAFTADNAAMHVELAGTLDAANPDLVPVNVGTNAFKNLLAEILASFARDSSGKPVLIAGAAYGEFDNFYEATGWFNALFGCNTWAARMARIAGLRTGQWNPLPQSLRLSLRLYN